MYMHVYSLLNV